MLCIIVGIAGALMALFVFDSLTGVSFGVDFVAVPSVFIAVWMVFIMFLALPYTVAGVALIRLQPWAPTLSTIVLTCGMVSFPLGTALGVYGLHLLTSPEVDEVFSPRFGR